MKNPIKILALTGLGLILASCSAVGDPYGNSNPNPYPNYPQNYPSGQVYRTADGTVYRQGEIYRDRRGDVYQNGRIIRRGDQTGYPGVLGRNGNVYYPNTNSRRLPPGQAKKIYGGNAKDYAPGQVKKRSRYYDDDDYDDDRYKKSKKYQKNDRYFRKGDDDRNKEIYKDRNGKRVKDRDDD